ncbi:zinc-binding dehydrogenase [Pelagibius sp. Alg239-R121]|uniref:zinc-dependent alcohol dehydrogenase n=1 Tax=Pelagibius sp. Alg239-R121 TaxID=2993448 RepID=UPI0024A6B334|nr:alcohol dehydrogenase catalytic domain-containing protein [Pelagibius sp. Alg239-R121]
MKAAVLEDWRHIVTRQVEPPVLEGGDALLRVSYAGVCGSDAHIFNGNNPIARTPVIQGHEFTGQLVEALGALPEGIAAGGRVVVQPLVSCGLCSPCKKGLPHVCEKLVVIGVNRDGGFAEFVRVPAEKLIAVPDDMPDEIATLTEPFAVGYHACSRARLNKGEAVLIIGAGPIGLYAAITARELGAGDVVVCETRPDRRALAEGFGFAAFDPANDACLADLKKVSDGKGYDVVIETSGVGAGINCAIEAAAVRGRIASLGFPSENFAPYNVTRGIIKELEFIGSRVYPLTEFRDTLFLLHDIFRRKAVDFTRIVTAVRGLEDLGKTVSDVADGRESGKVLIKPE